jgi:hypothetical protein
MTAMTTDSLAAGYGFDSLDALAAGYGFTRLDEPVAVGRVRYRGDRGRDAKPWSTVSYLASDLADRPEVRITVTFLLDANGKFLMGIGTSPGCADQRAYTFTAVRKLMADHSADVFAERNARAAARAAERQARRAEREAIDAARRERFVALVRKAAQAGFEIGQVRDRDEVAVSFDDMERILTALATTEVPA